MKMQLHPGARWLFRIRTFTSWLFPIVFLSIIMLASGFDRIVKVFAAGVLLYFGMFIILLIIIAEIFARMTYNRWFYEIGQDNIRLERGIIWKRYSNIPYERVQNVDIHRGIIARMCGFSSVMIQTAGYSAPVHGGYGTGVEGYLPAVGVDDAEKIREFVLKRIKGRNQGL
ncbi:MAG TPA: PH domain-containing protein [Candidatus Nanoarchaeia archaeon]|nr:PH domain-containing protein [Candidatus Nanoarchaeia archaeon]